MVDRMAGSWPTRPRTRRPSCPASTAWAVSSGSTWGRRRPRAAPVVRPRPAGSSSRRSCAGPRQPPRGRRRTAPSPYWRAGSPPCLRPVGIAQWVGHEVTNDVDGTVALLQTGAQHRVVGVVVLAQHAQEQAPLVPERPVQTSLPRPLAARRSSSEVPAYPLSQNAACTDDRTRFSSNWRGRGMTRCYRFWTDRFTIENGVPAGGPGSSSVTAYGRGGSGSRAARKPGRRMLLVAEHGLPVSPCSVRTQTRCSSSTGMIRSVERWYSPNCGSSATWRA